MDVTAEKIQEWKDKYGANKVKQVDLPVDDAGKEFVTVHTRVPDLRILNEWEKWSDKNPHKAKEILMKNCLLSGQELIYNERGEIKDEDLYISALMAITELIPIRKGIIKNC